MSISIKRIKQRNINSWNWRIRIAHASSMSLASYQSLIKSIREIDANKHAMKKAKGKEVKAWAELTPFLSSKTASLPVYPLGFKENAMYRMINLETMISELTEDEFYHYKAIILQNQEDERELGLITEFFESKIRLGPREY